VPAMCPIASQPMPEPKHEGHAGQTAQRRAREITNSTATSTPTRRARTVQVPPAMARCEPRPSQLPVPDPNADCADLVVVPMSGEAALAWQEDLER